METNNVAIYLDFENLAISAEEVYPSRDKPLLIEPIVDFAATKGNVCIRKAYADWSKGVFAQYQNMLTAQGFDLVHLPATNLQGKNGSDVKLAIDAMENLELFQMIDVIVIGSGDSDFIPLSQRIRARGKKLIVLGFDHSVGNLLKINSAEFRSLEELIGKPEKASLSSDLVQDVESTYGRDLVIRYIRNRTEDGPVLMSQLKLDLLRLDPSFSEKKMGFSSFKSFVESLSGDVVTKIALAEKSGLPVVYLSDADSSRKKRVNTRQEARKFLNGKLRFQKVPAKRGEMAKVLFDGFKKKKAMSMSQMTDFLHREMAGVAKIDIRKYVNTLFTGRAFNAHDKNARGPLLYRRFELKGTVNNSAVLEQIYIQRVVDILASRYSALTAEDIDALVHSKK